MVSILRAQTSFQVRLYRSLKNHGADREVEEMFEMGAETMSLPLEEKMKFEQGDSGQSFG